MHKLSPLHLQTLELSITEETDTDVLPDSGSHVTDGDCYQNSCIGNTQHHFIVDENRGESICNVCGMIATDHITIARLNPIYKDQDGVQDHDVIGQTYKRKSVKTADLANVPRPNNFRRVIARDGYYDAKERKEAEVMQMLRRLASLNDLDRNTVSTAFQHYVKLNRVHTFHNLPCIVYCTTLLYMSAIEQGSPIHLQRMVTKSTEIDAITLSDVNTVKYRIAKSGYVMKGTIMDLSTTLRAMFADLRRSGIGERTLIAAEYKSTEVLHRCHDVIRFHGNSTSYAPSIIYYASKAVGMPIAMELIAEHCHLSKMTIRGKYRTLVQILGDPTA